MKSVMLLLTALLFISPELYGQTLDKNTPPVLRRTFETKEGKTQTVYEIECSFTRATEGEDEEQAASDPSNWQLRGIRSAYRVYYVSSNVTGQKRFLRADIDPADDLLVEYRGDGSGPQTLEVKSKIAGKEHGGITFAKGRALSLGVRRVTDKRAIYAADYSFDVTVAAHQMSAGGKSIFLRSLSLDLTSSGTIGGEEFVRNGTQTRLGIAAKPFLFAGGLIYRLEGSVSYVIETRLDEITDNLLQVANKTAQAGVEIEVPYTNYPVYKLHAATGYARLAMPLTVSASYLLEGKDGNGATTPRRWDVSAMYELAFSPFLILRGEWNYSHIPDGLPDARKDARCYTLSIAQDLDVVAKEIGILKMIIGDSEAARGRHFVFYKISSGRQAPNFQDINEQSLGFGTYF
jgi:hypothetical protein